MRIEDLLKKEICQDFEVLSKLDLGSDEHKVGVDALTKLLDREAELRKLELEHQEKVEGRKAGDEIKMKELKENRVFRIIGYVVDAAGIVVPVLLTVWGTKVSLKFEENGTYTSTPGRNFIGRIFRWK